MNELTEFEKLNIESHYYVIYERPADYPAHFVIRKWTFSHGGGNDPIPSPLIGQVDTLEEARALIPNGLFRMRRDPFDDKTIVETWL